MTIKIVISLYGRIDMIWESGLVYNQKTRRPEDQKTRRPEDQKTRRPEDKQTNKNYATNKGRGAGDADPVGDGRRAGKGYTRPVR